MKFTKRKRKQTSTKKQEIERIKRSFNTRLQAYYIDVPESAQTYKRPKKTRHFTKLQWKLELTRLITSAKEYEDPQLKDCKCTFGKNFILQNHETSIVFIFQWLMPKIVYISGFHHLLPYLKLCAHLKLVSKNFQRIINTYFYKEPGRNWLPLGEKRYLCDSDDILNELIFPGALDLYEQVKENKIDFRNVVDDFGKIYHCLGLSTQKYKSVFMCKSNKGGLTATQLDFLKNDFFMYPRNERIIYTESVLLTYKSFKIFQDKEHPDGKVQRLKLRKKKLRENIESMKKLADESMQSGSFFHSEIYDIIDKHRRWRKPRSNMKRKYVH